MQHRHTHALFSVTMNFLHVVLKWVHTPHECFTTFDIILALVLTVTACRCSLFGLSADTAKRSLAANCRSVLLHGETRARTIKGVLALAPLSTLPPSAQMTMPVATAGMSVPTHTHTNTHHTSAFARRAATRARTRALNLISAFARRDARTHYHWCTVSCATASLCTCAISAGMSVHVLTYTLTHASHKCKTQFADVFFSTPCQRHGIKARQARATQTTATSAAETATTKESSRKQY